MAYSNIITGIAWRKEKKSLLHKVVKKFWMCLQFPVQIVIALYLHCTKWNQEILLVIYIVLYIVSDQIDVKHVSLHFSSTYDGLLRWRDDMISATWLIAFLNIFLRSTTRSCSIIFQFSRDFNSLFSSPPYMDIWIYISWFWKSSSWSFWDPKYPLSQ